MINAKWFGNNNSNMVYLAGKEGQSSEFVSEYTYSNNTKPVGYPSLTSHLQYIKQIDKTLAYCLAITC